MISANSDIYSPFYSAPNPRMSTEGRKVVWLKKYFLARTIDLAQEGRREGHCNAFCTYVQYIIFVVEGHILSSEIINYYRYLEISM